MNGLPRIPMTPALALVTTALFAIGAASGYVLGTAFGGGLVLWVLPLFVVLLALQLLFDAALWALIWPLRALALRRWPSLRPDRTHRSPLALTLALPLGFLIGTATGWLRSTLTTGAV